MGPKPNPVGFINREKIRTNTTLNNITLILKSSLYFDLCTNFWYP